MRGGGVPYGYDCPRGSKRLLMNQKEAHGQKGLSVKENPAQYYVGADCLLHESIGSHGEKREGFQSDAG